MKLNPCFSSHGYKYEIRENTSTESNAKYKLYWFDPWNDEWGFVGYVDSKKDAVRFAGYLYGNVLCCI